MTERLQNDNSRVDWLAHFRLGPSSSNHFRSARLRFLDELFEEPNADLSCWVDSDLRSLEPMLNGLHTLLADQFFDEIFMCQLGG